MTEEIREFTTDLAVIGSGLAGMAASIFALKRNISTAQAGNTGAIAYTTGYLDLFGYNESQVVDNPWTAISSLKKIQPNHPINKVDEEDIRNAFDEFTAFIGECGISYSEPGEENKTALTPAGTTKPTFSVPETMQAGVEAYSKKSNCLIIDFKGLRGFSGRQVVSNLKSNWNNLAAERISFPDMESGEIYPEVMARSLEVAATREKLAAAIKAVKGDAEVIGLPAVLGMHNPDKVMEDLSNRIGCPVFEIPTMPPSVPGIRLREMFEQVFPKKGLTLIPQQKISSIEFLENEIILTLKDNHGPITIHAKTAILATGRFISGGLEAERNGIIEPLMNIPVSQPESRSDWYQVEYMGKEGHGIHKCGIEVDEQFRPLDSDGKVVDSRLFAAGVILAHQDWIRGRCGAGVAIATAYKAVEEAAKMIS